MNFLQKYETLKKSIPIPAVAVGPYSQNCKLVDYTYRSKNCYHCFDCYRLEEGLYCTKGLGKKLVDCDYCVECELCYQSTECTHCYHSSYLQDCNYCQNCHFCTLCVSCSDCFGCAGLSHKKYCIFNKQYTKEEYERKVANLKKENPKKNLQLLFGLKQKIPHPQSQQYKNVNCPYGDYIYNSKDSYWCFDAFSVEDCAYFFDSGVAKQSFDSYFSGINSELCYELTDSDKCYHSAYLGRSGNCTDCYYGFQLTNCSDCFGCVSLINKKYCILNNQLTKTEYKKAVALIKKDFGWPATKE